ncbi:MAG: polyphosphate kinase 1 [Solirubrobacteraceae bacterium]
MQQPDAPPAPEPDLTDYAFYFNRELSWCDFNDRVLQLAEDESIPLLERLKFCAIYSSNLDEFFMVRVAGMQEYVAGGIDRPREDGRSPAETIAAIGEAVREQTRRQTDVLERVLRPELAEHGIRIQTCADVDAIHREELTERFQRQIFPVLTPLAVGLGRPFPYISNLSLSLAVLVRDPQTAQETFARVKVPKEMLPRFLPVGDGRTFVPLESLIAEHLDTLFPGMEVIDYDVFRVTRDADFTIDDEADDLLRAVEQELRKRRFGEVVRVEVGAGMSQRLREPLVHALEIEEDELFEVDGLLDLKDLWDIVGVSGFSDLRYAPWTPVTQPRLQPDDDAAPDVLAAMRRGDLLVHHPYDSFATSVERFVEQAAADPKVLAIKQTVYRTSDDSPLVPALIRAAERGKQAVCLVELKARFDERANIGWARAMEEAGVHVVYGLPTLKTHAKSILIVRREGDGVRHYVHVGTGNYHPKTARLYTDFGLFTCDEEIGADVADMFNQLTGFARPGEARRVLLAPAHMRDGVIAEIDRTIEAKQSGQQVRIQMKMNSLVDKRCIRALYRASRAGVPVDLNIRGICCLRPGVPGVSENVRVHSIVDRFLEHSRIYRFERGDEETILIGSADLMPRNLDTRVELLAPVRDAALRGEIADSMERCMADNTNAWVLGADGAWTRREPGTDGPRNVQDELRAFHAERAAEAQAAAS